MASTVAGLSEIDPEIAADPAAWYQRAGLARAASYPAARVAHAVGEHLGVRGPRCAISAACASSAMAIALAANMLLDGAASMMLAGGSDALCPFTLSGFNSLQALDPDPCRPFDRNRKGLNLGEGAAVLVLETLERAEARNANVLAVLRGWAMTNDAFHSTAPETQGKGLADCMRLAMEMAEVSGDDIGYVNAHGTGTPLNDVAETNAYDSVFRERKRPVPVSSTKSYFGHCLGAAGALEAIIAIIAVRCGALLPTLRLTEPIENPIVDWLRGKVLCQEVRLAMSVSAGFGGSNAALIFGNGQFGSGRS
jgi:3-oxoacyl-[acyl-carrier-protein] synthase II